MDHLAQERCVPCSGGAPPLHDEDLAAILPRLPGWSIVDSDSVPKLRRTYTVPNFAAALDLANRIGALAEAEDHHPALLVEWGRVTVTWWTHAIGGLHRNDAIMASKTDDVAECGG